MQDEFCKQLENVWEEVPSGLGYRFFVRTDRFDGSAIVSQISILPAEPGIFEVHLFTLSHEKYFTDGVVNSLFEDITRFVRHYHPECRDIKCKATYRKTVVHREWSVRQQIKLGRLIWK